MKLDIENSPREYATYQISETMMFGLRELYKRFNGDLTMAIVLGELGQYLSNYSYAGKHSPPCPQPYRHSNAHSIAAASGIPRETVRRKLDKLIALGWVIELPNGGVCLNHEAAPPLHQQFWDYNSELLSRMRQTVQLLEPLDL